MYEELLYNMWKESWWGGEFYTPRPVVKFLVRLVWLEINNNIKILDPFAGSGWFLVESYKYLLEKYNEEEISKKCKFIWFEKKFEGYLIWIMNLFLHWIKNFDYELWNTFARKKETFEWKFDYILTNPPFGAKEFKDTLEKSDWIEFKNLATEALGLEFVLKALKPKWKAVVILPSWQVLSWSWTFKELRKYLLKNFNLKYIINLPQGVFAENWTNINTTALVFDKGTKTTNTTIIHILWKYTKKKTIKFDELEPIINYLNWKSNKPDNILVWNINWNEIFRIEDEINNLIKNFSKKADKEILNFFYKDFFESEVFKNKQSIDKLYLKQLVNDFKKEPTKENKNKLLKELENELKKIDYSFVKKFEEKQEKVELNDLINLMDWILDWLNTCFKDIKKDLKILTKLN